MRFIIFMVNLRKFDHENENTKVKSAVNGGDGTKEESLPPPGNLSCSWSTNKLSVPGDLWVGLDARSASA